MAFPVLTQCSQLLRALDLHDFDRMCLKHLSCFAPKIKFALMSLEILAAECKSLTDRNGVEYDLLPLFQFLRELQASLPLEMDAVAILTKIKYLYFKRNLLSMLRGNLLHSYLDRAKQRLKVASGREEVEDDLWKVVRVLRTPNVPSEISNEDIHLYEFMANSLKRCYEEGVQDGRLVVALLKLTIPMRSVELSDTRTVIQPLYPNGFYKYLLKISRVERFDLPEYCRSHPHTLWEYSEIFSVVGAVSFGNYDRALSLLQHGVDVFPGNELLKSGHGYPNIEEIIPQEHRMVLSTMYRIRTINVILLSNFELPDHSLYSVTNDQKKCFELIWNAIPAPYVQYVELANYISEEYFHLATQHSVFNPMRYEKNVKFCGMYKVCFEEMALCPKQPRSLQHLSKCVIRKRLKGNWNLPDGICRLGLPLRLQRYLNLEQN